MTEFFSHETSLLRHCTKLEYLTITARHIINLSLSGYHRSGLSLASLPNLTGLCIPYRSFIMAGGISSFPPHLTKLVLVGSASDEVPLWEESPLIQNIVTAKLEGNNPCDLKHIQIALFSECSSEYVRQSHKGQDFEIEEIKGCNHYNGGE